MTRFFWDDPRQDVELAAGSFLRRGRNQAGNASVSTDANVYIFARARGLEVSAQLVLLFARPTVWKREAANSLDPILQVRNLFNCSNPTR